MATAAPTDPLGNGVIFAAQLAELISQHLSDGDHAAFDHLSQVYGLILVAKAIFMANDRDFDVAGFKRMVDHVWKQDVISVVTPEAKP